MTFLRSTVASWKPSRRKLSRERSKREIKVAMKIPAARVNLERLAQQVPSRHPRRIRPVVTHKAAIETPNARRLSAG